jgi:hypothetical protein
LHVARSEIVVIVEADFADDDGAGGLDRGARDGAASSLSA